MYQYKIIFGINEQCGTHSIDFNLAINPLYIFFRTILFVGRAT